MNYPKIKFATQKTKHPFSKIIAITYHTIIPSLLVYVAYRTDNWLWLIPIPFIILARLPEE